MNPEDEIKVNNSAQDEVTIHEPENVITLLQYVANCPNQSDWDLFRLTLAGIFYNYPPCCIGAFVYDISKNKFPGEKRGLDGNGFVPCKKHYMEYKNKVDVLHKLRVVYPYTISILSVVSGMCCYGLSDFLTIEMPDDKRVLCDELIKKKRKGFWKFCFDLTLQSYFHLIKLERTMFLRNRNIIEAMQRAYITHYGYTTHSIVQYHTGYWEYQKL